MCLAPSIIHRLPGKGIGFRRSRVTLHRSFAGKWAQNLSAQSLGQQNLNPLGAVIAPIGKSQVCDFRVTKAHRIRFRNKVKPLFPEGSRFEDCYVVRFPQAHRCNVLSTRVLPAIQGEAGKIGWPRAKRKRRWVLPLLVVSDCRRNSTIEYLRIFDGFLPRCHRAISWITERSPLGDPAVDEDPVFGRSLRADADTFETVRVSCLETNATFSIGYNPKRGRQALVPHALRQTASRGDRVRGRSSEIACILWERVQSPLDPKPIDQFIPCFPGGVAIVMGHQIPILCDAGVTERLEWRHENRSIVRHCCHCSLPQNLCASSEVISTKDVTITSCPRFNPSSIACCGGSSFEIGPRAVSIMATHSGLCR